MRVLTTLGLMFLLLLATRPAIVAQDADPAFERVAAAVAEKMKEYQVPGVAVGILSEGNATTRGFGVTNVDHPLPITDKTLFQIGSISKTFLGTAMMRLVEQRRVQLEAPVRTYLPDFAVADANASRSATVLDLLTHMGGWDGDVFEDMGEGDDALAKYVAHLKTDEQVAPLRTVWSYNNAGFVVAGRIIEVVTRKTYEEALEELVFDPLGLDDTYIRPADVMTLRFVVGHASRPTGTVVQRPWPIGRYAHPAGGVITTAPDLLKYALFHLSNGTANGTQVMSSATLSRMHQQVFVKQGTEEGMAVTWHVETKNVRRIGHGGSTVGQEALLTIAPDENFAMVVLTNSFRGGRLGQEVTRVALKEYLEVEESDPTPMASQPALQPFLARYSRPFADVVISSESDRLLMQVIAKKGFPNAKAPVPPPGPKVPIAFYAKDRAIVTDGAQKGARLDFIRNRDGSIGWVRVGGRIHRRTAVSS